LAAHKNDLVDRYLQQGLQHFPNDTELLEMRGKQAVGYGNYDEGQSYLKSALRAAQNPDTQGQRVTPQNTPQYKMIPGPTGPMERPRLKPPCRRQLVAG